MEGYCEQCPTQGIKFNRHDKKKFRTITSIQIKEAFGLLKETKGTFEIAGITILKLLYFSAITVHELLELRVKDLDLTKNTITIIRRLKGTTTKRTIWLTDEMRRVLKEHLTERSKKNSGGGYLFPNMCGERIYRTQIYYLVRRFFTPLGLVKIGPQILRNTAISQMTANGMDVVTFKYITGTIQSKPAGSIGPLDLDLVKENFLRTYPRW